MKVYIMARPYIVLAALTLLRQIAGDRVPNTPIVIEPDVRIRESSPPPGVRLAPKLAD